MYFNGGRSHWYEFCTFCTGYLWISLVRAVSVQVVFLSDPHEVNNTQFAAYWPSPLSGGLGLYASLIGFNPRRLKVLKRDELPRNGPSCPCEWKGGLLLLPQPWVNFTRTTTHVSLCVLQTFREINLWICEMTRVQTPGYVPKKNPVGFFWVHPPKKTHTSTLT